jgi:hypothetical protein
MNNLKSILIIVISTTASSRERVNEQGGTTRVLFHGEQTAI